MAEFILVLGMVIGLVEFYMIIAWWGNGCLQAGEAFVLFIIDAILLAVVVTDQSIAIKLLVTVLLFAPYLWIYRLFNQGSIKEILEEEAQKCRAAIQADPRNWGAHELLAKTLYNMGDIHTAIDEMRLALQLFPDLENAKYCIREWEAEKREKNTGIAVCPHCGTENESGRTWCRKCENKIIRYNEKPWYIQMGLKGVMTIFGSLTVIIASFVFLPTNYAYVPVVALGLILAGWKLVAQRA